MTHDEMVEVVGKALELEKKCSVAQSEYSTLAAQSYPALSVKTPTKGNTKEEKYPAIKTSVKMNYIKLLAIPGGIVMLGIIISSITFFIPNGVVSFIGGFICFLCFCGAIAFSMVYLFRTYIPTKNADIESIKKSDEYIEQCRKVDERNAQAIAALDLDYQKRLDEYNNVIVPKYNAEKLEWDTKHSEEVSGAKEKFDSIANELDNHYNATKIIPSKYHNIASLEYIYNIVSTSEYDFKEAAADLERERQNNIELQRVYAQQEQNDLIAEQNNIAEKARRDAAFRGVVGAVQSHNRNKALNDISKKL